MVRSLVEAIYSELVHADLPEVLPIDDLEKRSSEHSSEDVIQPLPRDYTLNILPVDDLVGRRPENDSTRIFNSCDTGLRIRHPLTRPYG